LALRGALRALDHLDDGLLGNQDLVEQVGLAHRLRALEQGLHGLVLVPRVGVDDVPLFRHRISANHLQEGRISWIALERPKSTTESAIVSTPTTISTPIVPATASWRV